MANTGTLGVVASETDSLGEGGRPSVSVIVPVYNVEDYLRACLDSLLAQTLADIEIICVNDGSPDGSLSILREYERADSRVVVIDQPNQGAAVARNNGIEAARGAYLSILDSDDFFEPDMLERAYARAEETDADIVVFGSDTFYVETGEHEPTPWTLRGKMLPDHEPFAGTDIERDAFKVFVGWSWDKLFKTSFVRENGLEFQPLRTSNDMRFVFCAIAKAGRIATLGDVLAHHSRGVGGLAETREKSWMCFHDALVSVKDQLRAWGLFEHYEQDFANYCLHASFWNYDSLVEPARSRLADRLVGEWFEEFGIYGKDPDYFYNKGELRKRDLLVAASLPKVSVVIPSLNSVDYYEECIKSAVSQDLDEIEVICVDAGSDDGTRDVIARYMKKDPRVRLVDSDVRSYGHQMNLGIDAARGEYLFVLESDDYIEPGTLSYYCGIADEHDLDFVKSDHAQFWDGEDGREYERRALNASPAYYNRLWNPSETPGLMHLKNLMQPGVYRLSFIRENEIRLNESPGASYQDNGFWYQVFSQAKRAMFTDRVCYMLRRDNPNSSVNSTGKVFAICDEYAFIRDVLKRRGREGFLGMCAQSYFGNCEWTMNRIGEWFLPQFLERVAADFRELEATGELDRRYFSARSWSTLHEIMEHGADYYHLEWYYRNRVKREQAKVAAQKLKTKEAKRTVRALKKEIAKIERSGSYRLGRNIAKPLTFWRMARRSASGGGSDYERDFDKWTNEIEVPQSSDAYQYFSTMSEDDAFAQMRRICVIRTGGKPNLEMPTSYNERVLAYRMRGGQAAEKAAMLDKYKAREIVASKVGSECLAPILGSWNRFTSIDFDSLPDSFVLECTHGRGMSMEVEEKSDLDIVFAQRQFEAWLASDFAYSNSLELEYRGITARIMAKPLVLDESGTVVKAPQYRMWCFGGAVRFIQLLSLEEGKLCSSFFDCDWVLQPFRYNTASHREIAGKPDALEKMVDIAERLSDSFEHIIIGLNCTEKGGVFFEEAYFSPDGGCNIWTPPEANFALGELWPQ